MKKTTNKSHHHEPRSGSSCAACKLLKRRCGPTCIFAPYFRADEPKKFAKVHKVFGASNVSKLLHEVPEEHRHDMVSSLTYEAEARLRDPIYGCLGPISYLYRRMAQLQHDLAMARARLAHCAAQDQARAHGGDGNSGGGVVVVGDCDEQYHHHQHIQELGSTMWNNGFQSDDHHGGNCSQLLMGNPLSPNGGCSVSGNGNDFGQVPVLPL